MSVTKSTKEAFAASLVESALGGGFVEEAARAVEAHFVPKYPECEKLSARGADRALLLDFFDWLGEDWTRLSLPPDTVVLRYFEIDETKLEAERRAMLEALRAKVKP